MKADITSKDITGNTSLHLAVHVKDTKPGFIKAGGSIFIDHWSSVPVSYQPCNIQTVQAIIKHGADVNAMNNKSQTALWFACCDGRMDLVKILLNKGADPNISDQNGESSLHAAMYGMCSSETTQELIDHGANVNALNKDGASPLLLACSVAQTDSVKLLLKAKADPNIAYTDGDSCLHTAIAADCRKETLQELIKSGADVNYLNTRGRTALLLSCWYRQTDSIMVLLEAGADPAIDDDEGFSCIHAAVDGICSKETLQLLIAHGAHIDAKRKDGTNALLRACATGQSDTVNFLVESGADVNVNKPDGNTCLHVAVNGNCSKEVLEKMVDNGVHINGVNNEGKTALMLACQSAQAVSVGLLLAKGADPNIYDVYGNTSLHAAVFGCYTTEALHKIITHQAYLDIQNINGETALLLACLYRQQDMISILLKAGSNTNIRDNYGDTSLHAAVYRNCTKKIIRAIITHGAEVNATNKLNSTALMLASEKGNIDAMKVLLKAGASPAITDVRGGTWLHSALCGHCSTEALQTIIDLGAEVNATNEQNCTALMLAAEKGNIDDMNVLLKAGANRAIKDADGYTWLHYAVSGDCNKDVLQAVIDLGVEINATNKQNCTALMLASKKGKIDAINVLLKAGANRDIKDADGDTWLHYAVHGDCSKDVLQAVIGLDAEVNATNKQNCTALMLASKKGNTDAMNVLLKAGANSAVTDAYGNSWLQYAICGNCSTDALQTIIDLGAEVNATVEQNCTALMLAAEKGNIDDMNVLLKAGANRAIKDADGYTWLHYAVSGDCNKDVLQAVIDLGAEMNATNKHNCTALMLASKKGKIDAMNVLLNAGANRAITDAYGDTWLHYAVCGDCSKDVLQAIIDQGAEVNATNKQNCTALMLASNKGNINNINVLLKAGASRKIQDSGGNTWLHYAVWGECSTGVLQAIIDLGAEVNSTNKHNATALMVASMKGNVDAIMVLLDAGANQAIEDADGNTWLHYAVHGDCSKDVLQAVIDLGADLNATNKQNCTALMLASKKGNVDAMNLLLTAGANRDIQDSDGDTWLHYAVCGDCSKDVLQTVIDQGAELNSTNKQNRTPLLLASIEGNADAIMVLLNAGANQAIEDAYGNTWLHCVVSGDCSKDILQTVTDLGAEVNATNKQYCTALMFASVKGNIDAMNVLLNTGANRNIQDADGNTWLHYAVFGDCSKEVLQVVIDLGAEVNATNKHNTTALMVASMKGNVDAIMVLLDAGANQAIEDVYGNTWLHYAIHGDCSKKVLQAVIDLGADVNATNKPNRTALMLASSMGNVDAINVLLGIGADFNVTDVDGNTLLHHAINTHINKETLLAIIHLGTIVNVVNNEGSTALLLACSAGQTDSADILLQAGADTSIVDIHGDTCLHKILYRKCDQETLQILLDHDVPVNIVNKNHQTAYTLACIQGDVDAMGVLVNAGANPNIASGDDLDDTRPCCGTYGCINRTLQTIVQCLSVRSRQVFRSDYNQVRSDSV